MTKRVWIVIICAGAILSVVMGFRQTFGLFLPDITKHIGSGRETFSFAMALMNLLWGIGSPFAGAFADRYGVGRVAVGGGLLYALGLWMMSTADGSAMLMLAGVMVGFGLSGAGFSVVLGAVGRVVSPAHRSKALALASMGGSVGQFLAVPYVQGLIGSMDWITSLLILAGMSLIIVPLARGLVVKDETKASKFQSPKQTLKESLREAANHKGFWLLNAGFFVCGFNLAFIGIHMPAYLGDQGFQPWLAASGLMLIGAMNMVGTYVFGTMGGKFLKKHVLSTIYFGRALVFLFFLMFPLSEFSVLAFSVAMGFLWLATVPLTSGLVAHIFGPAYMSMLYGIVFFSHQLGSFSGSWLAGYLFDSTGSYELMWWINVGLGIAAALIHLPIVERPVARLAATGSD